MAECKDSPADQVHGNVDSKAVEEGTSCQPCKVDKNIVPAMGWCETCDEMLCSECYKYHCRLTMMKNHQLKYIADIKDMKQTKMLSDTCDRHEGNSLEYVCEGHAELCCSRCFITKHRSCSNVFCISDVKTEKWKVVRTLETLLSQFATRLKANEETIERNWGFAARQHEKALADIKKAGDKLKAHIDDLVRQQIFKAQKRNEDNMRIVSYVEETNKSLAEKVKDGIEMLAAGKNDDTRLFITMNSVQNEVDKMKAELDDSENRNKVREYVFKLSPELVDVLEKVKHIGTLKDTYLLDLEKATDEVLDVVEVRRFQKIGGFSSTKAYVSDAIGVFTDHDIRLLNVLVCPRNEGVTTVLLSISEGGNCLLRCNSSHRGEEDREVLAVNVVRECGADGITLQAGHQYVIDVAREGGRGFCYYFYGLGALSKVTEKGVTVTFSNTPKRSKHDEIIAGLRFSIL